FFINPRGYGRRYLFIFSRFPFPFSLTYIYYCRRLLRYFFLQLRHQLRRLIFVEIILLIDVTFENISQSSRYFVLLWPIEIKHVRPFAYTTLSFRNNRIARRCFIIKWLRFY